MARFDIFVNPNKAARHGLLVDVQSDLVRIGTRWCIPMSIYRKGQPIIRGAQIHIGVNADRYVFDATNPLSVPTLMLRRHLGHLSSADQLAAESCIEFMLRGY